jgi:alpha-1,2-mannosyltransferase
VVVGDGRSWRRTVLAAGTWLFYVLEVPWWGITILAHHTAPRFIGKIVQDAYGLGALILLTVIIRFLPIRTVTNPESDGVGTSRDEAPVGTLGS